MHISYDGRGLVNNNYTIRQVLLMISTTVYFFLESVFRARADMLVYSKVAFLITFVLALCNIKKIRFRSCDVCLLTFVIICAFSVLWSPLPDMSLSMTITLVQLLAMFVVFRMGYESFGTEIVFLKIMVAYGVMIGVFFLFQYGIGGYIEALTGNGRLGGEFANPNSLGCAAAFSFVASVYLAYIQRRRRGIIVSVFPGVVMLGAGSRTALVVAIVGIGLIVLHYLFSKYERKKIRKYILFVLGIVFLTIMVINLSKIDIFHSLFSRFEVLFDTLRGKTSLKGSVTERLEMMQIGMKLFAENPLLGVGINAAKVAINEAGMHYTYLHNNFIELLGCVGILGFISYYMLYLLPLRNIREKVKNNYFVILFLAMMLVFEIGGVTYYIQRNCLYLVFVTVASGRKSDGVLRPSCMAK